MIASGYGRLECGGYPTRFTRDDTLYLLVGMSEADHACYVGRKDAEAINVYWLDDELNRVDTRTFRDTVEAEVTQFLNGQAWRSLSTFGELYLDPGDRSS